MTLSIITSKSGVQFAFSDRKRIPPVPAHPQILDAIEESCRELDVPFHHLPSGAGHDAQMVARIAPMGMIFVPSEGGISHSIEEYTSAEDCALGANVLLLSVLHLDDQQSIGLPGASPA